MVTLNQGKIVKALESAVKGPQQDFIWEFLKAYGTSAATLKRLRLGDGQRNVAKLEGDLGVPQKLYFRAVPEGQPLPDALAEILALPTLAAHKIRFVMVTDFTTVMAHDRKVDDTVTFDFAELPQNYEFFLPMTGLYEKPVAYAEHPADTKACEKMGRLYDGIRKINDYQKNELHALNVFLTRLLFCFFAEDTGIFPKEQQMTDAVQSLTKEDGSDVADFFQTLFKVLDQPPDAPERKHLPASFRAFPYVNGELFREKVRIPNFDRRTRRLLIDCGNMKWSEISPVIFGSMFQAVMDQDARRSLGAHYTSEKNILKVVRPLFLDALEDEFQAILALKKDKTKALKDFKKKLGSLTFLDPACGCGNFLIVAYRELRELELRVLLAMREEFIGDTDFQWLNVDLLTGVTIEQFYGIELEEFPVDVARVSLWLMEHVMNVKLGQTFGLVVPTIPLKHAANIVCANALTTPWEEVVAPEKLNYILGNPPFVGASNMKRHQKEELMEVFNSRVGAGKLDFVTAWYEKASLYMLKNKIIETAFVSTNSICQGEQVAYLWTSLLERGLIINFAHQTFQWTNEAKNKAAVYCIIIGFSYRERDWKRLFIYPHIRFDPTELCCTNINPYLVDSAAVLVNAENYALSAPISMEYGNKPTDGGNLIIEACDYEAFVRQEPKATPYIKKLTGTEEFLHGKQRYCLWLVDAPEEILELPLVAQRIENCRQMRLASRDAGCRKLAARASQFRDIHNPASALVVACHSSERRKYIPMGIIGKDVVVTNSVHIVPNATHYDFAILTSAMHMAWMRTVCGRLEMRYRYSRDLCYNTFPWPTVSAAQKQEIERVAEEVLAAREAHPELTLAEMYDPDKMPADLRQAHHALDMAVDALYRKKPFANDEERLQLLFKLYEDLVKKK
ncbi:MAG: hypothetical protein K2J64_05785 [Desulfovibrio sp.]|nr:hypothetical protein [Desulfovibrio sp.]